MAEEKVTKKIDVDKIVIGILAAILVFMTGYVLKLNSTIHKKIETIETVSTQDNKYTQYYYEREFKALKDENKALYDSLKNQQDYITSLQQFSYNKSYNTGIVDTKPEIPQEVEELPDSTYYYANETDSISYELNVNSKVEPNWYSLNFEVNDKFTIVNKEYQDGRLTTSIESEHQGEITDITAWQKPSSTKWYKRFAIGPSISVGYDPINRNCGVMVGFSVTYNILGK